MADEVAKALSAALDVIIAKKLRAPYQPELGIGAVVDGDHIFLNEKLVHAVGASQDYLNVRLLFRRRRLSGGCDFIGTAGPTRR